MSGKEIEMAKEALKLFIQSLPQGAMFEVVSFGSRFEISSKDKCGYENNDTNINNIKQEIDSYSADFGGTNILDPMEFLINKYLIKFEDETTHDSFLQDKLKGKLKRLFLLTDGEVGNPDKVI